MVWKLKVSNIFLPDDDDDDDDDDSVVVFIYIYIYSSHNKNPNKYMGDIPTRSATVDVADFPWLTYLKTNGGLQNSMDRKGLYVPNWCQRNPYTL